MPILYQDGARLPHDLETRDQCCLRKAVPKWPIRKICSYYHVSKRSLLRWLKRFDGTWDSLLPGSHARKSGHPREADLRAVKKMLGLRRRNPNDTVLELWAKCLRSGFGISRARPQGPSDGQRQRVLRQGVQKGEIQIRPRLSELRRAVPPVRRCHAQVHQAEDPRAQRQGREESPRRRGEVLQIPEVPRPPLFPEVLEGMEPQVQFDAQTGPGPQIAQRGGGRGPYPGLRGDGRGQVPETL